VISNRASNERKHKVNQPDDPARLLIDPAVLDRLRAELDDDESYLLFLENFLAQLPRRIQKLRLSLLKGDHALAIDAVLSLKISSQMFGAERLAAMAIHIQRSPPGRSSPRACHRCLA
jgi:HPt (histidine-containing phosphotransfer) domain-containing protein